MAEGLVKTNCPSCNKLVGLKPSQVGKRVRCPGCRTGFVVLEDTPAPPPPAQPPSPPPPPPPASEPLIFFEIEEPPTRTKPPPIDLGWELADDANELARVEPPQQARPEPSQQDWPRAKLTASFQRSKDLVFQAVVQAARHSRCDIVTVDRVNAHIAFTFEVVPGMSTGHDVFIFESPSGGCEIDIQSQTGNEDGQFDPHYQSIVREIGKYLYFASENQPKPLPKATVRELPEYRPRRRYRRSRSNGGGVDGLGIAGMVCGIVGIVTSCIPILGGLFGVLGIVFGGISLGNPRRRGGNGMAVAGLVTGIVACLLAFVFFLIFVTADAPRHR